MDKIKGMYVCSVCGKEFPLNAEDSYVSKGAELLRGLTLWDSIDCPHCGCQHRLKERYAYATPEDLCAWEGCEGCDGDVKEETGETKADGCNGCKHQSTRPDKDPCYSCARNHMDLYERGE